MSGVPQGWKDDGKTLVAPNGKAITPGFRSWVLAHDWRSDDYPLDNAYGTNPEATIQHFVYEYLDWSAKAGVNNDFLIIVVLLGEGLTLMIFYGTL